MRRGGVGGGVLQSDLRRTAAAACLAQVSSGDSIVRGFPGRKRALLVADGGIYWTPVNPQIPLTPRYLSRVLQGVLSRKVFPIANSIWSNRWICRVFIINTHRGWIRALTRADGGLMKSSKMLSETSSSFSKTAFRTLRFNGWGQDLRVEGMNFSPHRLPHPGTLLRKKLFYH